MQLIPNEDWFFGLAQPLVAELRIGRTGETAAKVARLPLEHIPSVP